MRTLSSTLSSAQANATLNPKPKLVLSKTGEDDVTYTESRFLSINQVEEPYKFNAKVVLDNSDGGLTSLDFQGWKATLYWGLVTKAGNEYSQVSPTWVKAQQFNSAPGGLTCELTLLGIPDLMDLDEASAAYIPAETGAGSSILETTTQAIVYTKVKEVKLVKDIANAKVTFNLKTNNALGTAYAKIYKNGVAIGTERSTTSTAYVAFSEEFSGWVKDDLIQIYAYISNASYIAYVEEMRIYSVDAANLAKTVKTLIREIAGDTGVTHLACFNHTQKYDVVFDGTDDLINNYKPADGFRIYQRGSRLAALKRLLQFTKCVMRFESDGNIHIFVPTTSL